MSTRISTQARAVLNVLAERRCHLTAEEILESLDNIGTATVYRALDHLTELGMIRRLGLGKKSAVYEYVRDSHVHFVCNRCGQVYDIHADFSGMVKEAARVCGHQVNWVEVTAHGMCCACLNNQDETDAVSASEA
ncbi:MAG: transcriptional repressor [Clostridia bacterium]|nr:transcriptional repressor [Clostridia bacterium]